MAKLLTRNLWRIVEKKIVTLSDIPDWVKKLTTISFADLKEKSLMLGYDFATSELRFITESYLDFLKEQIDLNARGDEWSAILKKRLNAIEPYKNNNLLSVRISDDSNLFNIYLIPSPEFKAIHWEFFNVDFPI